jgi:hypothetical protein
VSLGIRVPDLVFGRKRILNQPVLDLDILVKNAFQQTGDIQTSEADFLKADGRFCPSGFQARLRAPVL